ncbi:MAG: DMT family protein, partial [Kiritimatiellae bacterium]|nr:DMT family protein [Kiritimatiellia bacterium]
MSNINWMAVALLFVSNMIMLYAWYGHLKSMESSPVWVVVLVSWG